jgi:hypothetical protein
MQAKHRFPEEPPYLTKEGKVALVTQRRASDLR